MKRLHILLGVLLGLGVICLLACSWWAAALTVMFNDFTKVMPVPGL